MKFSFFAFQLTILLAASVAAAETRFTIDDAVRTALTNNLDLQAASFRIDEARTRVGQAGRLTNPELETDFEPNVRGREYSFRIGFNQRFPVTSRLRLEKELSRLHVKVAEAEVNDFRRKLSFEVHAAAIRFASLGASVRLQEQQLQNTLAIAKVTSEAAKVGEASEIDAAQLELAADHLRLQQAQIQMQQAEANRALLGLLGLTNETVLLIDDALPAPHTESDSTNAPAWPIQASQQARFQAAEQAIRLAQAARWDDIRVGLFTGVDRREDLPVGLQTDHSVGVRLSIPIPLWNRKKGHVAEAEATFGRLEKEAAAFKQHLTHERALAQEQMAAASKALTAIREQLLPKARRLEERLLALHKEGQTPFTDTLRARDRRFELEAAEINARRDFHLGRARYLAATGQILNPNHE